MKIKNILQSGLRTMLFFVLLGTVTSAMAYDFEVDGIFYTASGTTATVTYETSAYNSYSGDIIIPETVTYNGTTYTVTAIGDEAFLDCTGLTSVSIPVTVTAIGTNNVQKPGQSFGNCTSLTSVVIPDNVESLGRLTFYGCTNLRNVTIGKSIPALKLKRGSVTFYAFQGCNNITSLTWNAVDCQDNGGMGTTNIEQVTIGPEVQAIPNNFVKGSKIDEITIPNSVTYISNSAFEACTSLTSINIPNSTISVGSKAFYNCSGIENLSIGNSVTSIGSNAFSGCTNLKRVNISNLGAWCGFQFESETDNPLHYAGSLYLDGQELTNLVIPDTITAINAYVFDNCKSITSVTIPNSVTAIGASAFEGCENLTRVDISSLEAWCSIQFETAGISNPLFYARHIFLNNHEINNLVIPNTITAINAYTFENCISITSVIIPNSVTKIGSWAFSDCIGLTDVSLGLSVDTIGYGAFHGCVALGSISIPNSVTCIDGVAFGYCQSLTEVLVPSSVQFIGWCAFSFCPITSIIVEDGNQVYDSRDHCNAVIETATNTLMIGCNSTIIPRSVTSIAPYAFTGVSGITSIFIPSSVTSIENDADYYRFGSFAGCDALVSIVVEDGNPVYDSRDNCNAIIETATNTLIVGCGSTIIPNTVTTIGASSFALCSSLTTISFPNSVKSIDHDAFFNCSNLATIDFGDSITTISDNAFLYCTGLKEIDIPVSVTSIGWNAFGSCTGLINVTIPNSFIVTEPYAADSWFVGCTGLTNVTIGSGMAYMGIMFLECSNITNVTCLATTPPETDGFVRMENGQRIYFSNFDPGVYEQATLFVPASSLEAYRTAQYWKDFQSIRPLGDADGDGGLGIADVSNLIDKLLTGDTDIINSPGADVDGDGKISIADVSTLIDILLNS